MLTAQEFLERFRSLHCFQIFGDNAEAKKTIFPRWFFNTFNEAEKQLRELNNRGGGIFFVVNETDGQGRTEKNITKITSCFVDLDGAPLDAVLNCEIMPSIVVETRPGRYHCYWFVKDVSLQDFPVIQLALAQKFNGDKTVKDVCRVMRVPTFYNQKDNSFLVRAKSLNKDVISGDQLITKLELNIHASISEYTKTTVKLSETHLVGEGERHETLMKLARKWAAKGLEESEILDILTIANNRFTPPLPASRFEEEARRIISTVKNYEGGTLGTVQIVNDEPDEEEEEHKIELPATAITDDIVAKAPNLVGELVKAITDSAIFPIPILALQSALVIVSMLKRKNYVGYFNGFCNLYTIGTGSAAGGKGHNLSCVDSILAACGADGYTVGKLVSSPSVSTALNRTGGCSLSMIDEAGIYLKPLLINRYSDKNALGLRETLMVMFNANRKVRGAEYSSRQGATERLDVQSPFLSVYGVTTPETFYSNISAEHAADGFLSRWLIFESIEPEQRKRNWSAGNKEIDIKLLEELQRISNILTARPMKLKFTSGGEDLYRDIINYYDKITQEKKDTNEVSIRGRQGEHFDKLCTILSNIDNETNIEAIEYANKLVIGCSDTLCTHLTDENLHKSSIGEKTEQFIKFLKLGGRNGRTKTEISKRMYHIPAKEREEIMNTLLEGKRVKVWQRPTRTGRLETRLRFVN